MLGSRPVLLLLGTSSLCAGWSLRAAPLAPSRLQAASPAPRLRVAVAPHLNEEDDGTGEGGEMAGELDSEVLKLLSRLRISGGTVRTLAAYGIGFGAMRRARCCDHLL